MSKWDYTEKKAELMEAAMTAFDILVDALREDIDLKNLGDEKIKTAIQSKRVAFMDAYEILSKINDLDRSINGNKAGGNVGGLEETAYPTPLAERFIRKEK